MSIRERSTSTSRRSRRPALSSKRPSRGVKDGKKGLIPDRPHQLLCLRALWCHGQVVEHRAVPVGRDLAVEQQQELLYKGGSSIGAHLGVGAVAERHVLDCGALGAFFLDVLCRLVVGDRRVDLGVDEHGREARERRHLLTKRLPLEHLLIDRGRGYVGDVEGVVECEIRKEGLLGDAEGAVAHRLVGDCRVGEHVLVKERAELRVGVGQACGPKEILMKDRGQLL